MSDHFVPDRPAVQPASLPGKPGDADEIARVIAAGLILKAAGFINGRVSVEDWEAAVADALALVRAAVRSDGEADRAASAERIAALEAERDAAREAARWHEHNWQQERDLKVLAIEHCRSAEATVEELEGELKFSREETENANTELAAARAEIARLREDAERWRALVSCRMHFMGCSGFDVVDGELAPRPGEPQHFGMEIWSFPKPAGEAGEKSDARARLCLVAVADAARAALAPAQPDLGAVFEIEHDGFVGEVIGRYVTHEGKRGAVLQQVGSRVVHVYGEKWLKPRAPAQPDPKPETTGE